MNQSDLASTPMVWAVPLIAAPTLGREEYLCAGDQNATPIGPLAANLNVQTHVSCVLSCKWPEIRFCGIPLVWAREIKSLHLTGKMSGCPRPAVLLRGKFH